MRAKAERLPGTVSAKARHAWKTRKGQLASIQKPHERPVWVKEATAYLHDADRNLQLSNWSVQTLLGSRGISTRNETAATLVKKVKDKPIRNVLLLLSEYASLKGKIVNISRKKTLNYLDETEISRLARKILAVNSKLRVGCSQLKGSFTELGKYYYESYLQNFHIVASSLKPLIEMKQRTYERRDSIPLSEFFADYSTKHFPDRGGEKLRVIFNIPAGVDM